jgi:hypothetical protein
MATGTKLILIFRLNVGFNNDTNIGKSGNYANRNTGFLIFRPAPCALRPAPCALRPVPCALCPAPCALCPATLYNAARALS